MVEMEVESSDEEEDETEETPTGKQEANSGVQVSGCNRCRCHRFALSADLSMNLRYWCFLHSFVALLNLGRDSI